MYLRNYERSCDLNFLYEAMSEECRIHSLNSDIDFENWLNRAFSTSYHVFNMIYDSGVPIGYICTYDYRVLDAHCKMKFYVKREVVNDFSSIFNEFTNRLFREYPLNKIFYYFTVSDGVEHDIMTKIGFVDEITLKDYFFQNGKYIDITIMSLTKVDKGYR